jgi:hypothetical protein
MTSMAEPPALSNSFFTTVSHVTSGKRTAALLGFPHFTAHGQGIVDGDWRWKNLYCHPADLGILPVKRPVVTPERDSKYGLQLKWCHPT